MRDEAPERRVGRGALAATVALALPLLGAACSIPPVDPQQETVRHPYYGLEDYQPSDLAVIPVADQSDEGGVPVDVLREGLYRGLAARFYSPIDLDFVDVHWAEAGFATGAPAASGADPGDAMGAGGLLRVVVRDWDRSLLGTHGVIRATVTAEILDGRRPGAAPLWGVTLERRIKLAYDQTRLDEPVLSARAARILADEILREIPVRTPGPVGD